MIRLRLLLALGLAGGLAWALVAQAQTSCVVQGATATLNSFADTVGVGAITPQVLRNFVCSVPFAQGIWTIYTQAAPSAPPAGQFYIYMDGADNKLKARGPSGTVTTLALP